MEQEERHPIVTGIALLVAAAAVIFTTWCTVIAFVGGTMPIGIETDGSVGLGLFWLVFIVPIAAALCYWATVLIFSPFVAVSVARESRRSASDDA